MVDAIFVNIWDLVDTVFTGEPVELFKSEALLSEYTRGERKYFPKKNAYAGGLLRYLLRRIMNPRTGVEGEASHIAAQVGNRNRR